MSFQFSQTPMEQGDGVGQPTGWLSLLQQFADKIILVVVLILAFFAIRGVLNKMSSQLPALPAAQQVTLVGAAGQPMIASAMPAHAVAGATHAQLPHGAAESAAAHAGGAMSPMGQATTIMSADGPKVVFRSASSGTQLIELDDGGPSVEALKAQEMLNRTVAFVTNKPDNAAQILRSWVLDGTT